MRLKRRLGDSGAAQATNPKSAGSPLPGKAITGRRTLPNIAEQCRTMPNNAEKGCSIPARLSSHSSASVWKQRLMALVETVG